MITEIIILVCIFVVICEAQSGYAESKTEQNEEDDLNVKGINQSLLENPSSSN